MVQYSGTVKVAVVQAAPVWFDLDATIDKAIDLIDTASAEGARLIAFPELWVPGYPHFIWSESNSVWPAKFLVKFHENSLEIDSAQMHRLQETARRNEIAIVLGASERDAGSLYISQVVIDELGELRSVRRKFKPTHAERTLFGEGDGSDFQVFDFPFGRVGALSCWEHMQPLIKYTMNSLSEQIHVASWPAMTQPYIEPFGTRGYETINRLYAMENQCFVLCSTAVFDEAARALMTDTDEKRELLHAGGGVTRIFGPDGRDVVQPLPADVEGLLYAEIDLSEIVLAKNVLDQVGHYSRPSIFSLHVDNSSPRAVHFSSPHRESLRLSDRTSKGTKHSIDAPNDLLGRIVNNSPSRPEDEWAAGSSAEAVADRLLAQEAVAHQP